MSAATKDCRLPAHTRPTNYALHISPDLASFTFDGVCVVTVDVIDGPVSTIKCHAKELTFTSIVADGTNVSSSNVRAKRVSFSI